MQVEDHVCLTGGDDGNVRLWDLRRIDEDDWEGEMVSLSDVVEEDEAEVDDGEDTTSPNGVRSSSKTEEKRDDACAKLLEGHTKAVTALYFEDDCLVSSLALRCTYLTANDSLPRFQVTGASDKTLRQWDLTTGQCVMTMDILWAISHQTTAIPGGPLHTNMFSGGTAATGTFAVPTPPYADGSWEMYQDFVGGVQFWGYGLVSGSGDGAVRMWDSECISSVMLMRRCVC